MKRFIVALALAVTAVTVCAADQLICEDYVTKYRQRLAQRCHWVVDLSDLPKNIPARTTVDHSIQSVKEYNDHEVRVDRNDGTSQYCSKNILGEWSCN